MNVDAPIVTRRIVNADNTNEFIEDTKRNQYIPNKALKKKVLQALIHCHIQLGLGFSTDPPFLNISFANQITSHLMTIHNVLRQQSNANKIGKLSEKVPENLTTTVEGEIKMYSSKTALEMVAHIARLNGPTTGSFTHMTDPIHLNGTEWLHFFSHSSLHSTIG